MQGMESGVGVFLCSPGSSSERVEVGAVVVEHVVRAAAVQPPEAEQTEDEAPPPAPEAAHRREHCQRDQREAE